MFGPLDDTDTLLRFLGRFHVVLVHFPIALVLAAAWFEFVGRAATQAARRSAAGKLLLLALLGAAAAATTGWWTAAAEPHSRAMESDLFWHRWTAVSAAVVTLLAWIGSLAANRERGLKLYRWGLALAAVLVSAAGHLGGELVHGEGFLTEVLTASSSDPAPATTVTPPTTATGDLVPTVARVDYAADVVPILAGHCYSCHGPDKAKARLRLDHIDTLFAVPVADGLIVPGDAGASELFRRVNLPADDLDIMPADGPPLSAEQIQTLRLWIDQGARHGAASPPPEKHVRAPASAPPVGELAAGEEALPATIAEHAFVEPDLAPVPLPQDTANLLAALTAGDGLAGVVAGPVAANSTAVGVDFSLAGAAVGDAQLAALDGLQDELMLLDLSHTAVTDDGLATLSEFHALSRLRLAHTDIGDAGLEHLSDLVGLQSLNLVETDVGDAGLAHLTGLHDLRALYLWRTRCTAGGRATLQAALPELAIIDDDA